MILGKTNAAKHFAPAPLPSLELVDLPLGSCVNGGKFRNFPISWKIIDKGYAAYGADTITLIADKILALACYDAREPLHPFDRCQQSGFHQFSISNLWQWLNSSAAKGAWFLPLSTTDAPPIAENVKFSPYFDQPGFMSEFPQWFKNALLTVNTMSAYVKPMYPFYFMESVPSKVFLPSRTQLGFARIANVNQGEKFAYFDTTEKTAAFPHESAFLQTEFSDAEFNPQSRWHYSTSTASKTYYFTYDVLKNNGNIEEFDCNTGSIGVRPIINLSKSQRVVLNNTTGNYEVIE